MSCFTWKVAVVRPDGQKKVYKKKQESWMAHGVTKSVLPNISYLVPLVTVVSAWSAGSCSILRALAATKDCRLVDTALLGYSVNCVEI
jgi:hypothetical protein